MDWLIAGRFRVCYLIGSGTYGEVYLGVDTKSGREVALKFERAPSPTPQLHNEFHAYTQLADSVGIPSLHWIGYERSFVILVIEHLGRSLEDILIAQRRPFSLKALLMITDQCLRRVEFIHRKLLLHRDIKPTNLLMGFGDRQFTLYFIDFGLSRFYRDPDTLTHIPMVQHSSIVGTPYYASLNVMRDWSRRGEMI
jgi:serine/threonine protein kinase